MFLPKSKRDREIYHFLKANLSNKYDIHYKNSSISLEWFSLKIDFIIQLKKEFLFDETRPIFFYLQNAHNASLKKMTQIYDLLLSYTCVSIVWSEDEVNKKLELLVNMLNDVADENKFDDIISPNLKFLMYCDVHDKDELQKFTDEIRMFTSALTDLERDHGIEEEVNEEDEDMDQEFLN